MTRRAHLKDRIRARMAKTGERYTTARRQVLAAAEPSPNDSTNAAAAVGPPAGSPEPRSTPPAAAGGVSPAPDLPPAAAEPAAAPPAVAVAASRWGGISDAAIRRATGRDWAAWITALDAAGASELDHPSIARLVASLGTGDWWSQMVTVGYEQAKGRRVVHQTRSGFVANVSRTFPVPVEQLFAAWSEVDVRARWLAPEAPLTVRKATAPRSLRAAWDGRAVLALNFWAKGEQRAQVQLQHSGLPDADAVVTTKAFWRQQLDRMGQLLGARAAERRVGPQRRSGNMG